DDKEFRVFPSEKTLISERLNVGDWIALSGAAVSPGLGPRTRVATSVLLAFFNFRLGAWWDSGVEPAERLKGGRRVLRVFAAVIEGLAPVYASFMEEAFARFRGVARRHWYLSDGGHVENTGCYELLRRRIPIIICCDAGADPHYQFDDVGNLVR